MSSILEVSIDSEDFVLGRTLNVDFDVTITLEEVIPTGNRAMPYFWVSGNSLAEFEESIEADPTVEAIHQHLRLSESALYRAQWAEQVQSLLYSIAEEEGTILDGVGSSGTWQFTLRFPSRDSLSNFRRRCSDLSIDLDVKRVYSVSADQIDMEYGLTAKQRETLITALEQGYFQVPRESTQQELAESLGIQSSSASETLRRAMAELIANTLLEKRTV
jgi:predicted DNA binding protein